VKVAVVMSGGRGRRFWPLSRAGKAKQLIRLAGGKTLLELTLERIAPLFEADRVLVVTQQCQVNETEEVVKKFEGVTILSEPTGKNTAPCVALATTFIEATMGDACVAVLPADHFIQDAESFGRVLTKGLGFVAYHRAILTVGIKPERPATGFGYIRIGDLVEKRGGLEFFKVDRFAEKPALEAAQRYLAGGGYLWNAGIFMFKTSVMQDEIRRYLPGMAAEFEGCRSAIGGPEEAECLAQCYSSIEELSIDFGVIEKTQIAHVVPGDIGWDDVGSWDSFSRYMAKDEQSNSVQGPHVGIDTSNCIIYSDCRMIATLGIENITIVATDDAILVTRRERGEEVKDLVDLMEREGLQDLL
jgi:mannose-1-phosphate guanylyltransferase